MANSARAHQAQRGDVKVHGAPLLCVVGRDQQRGKLVVNEGGRLPEGRAMQAARERRQLKKLLGGCFFGGGAVCAGEGAAGRGRGVCVEGMGSY